MAEDNGRSEAAQQQSHRAPTESSKKWAGPALLMALVVTPIVILIFSNLEATEVSWAGLRFNQPLWGVLIATFLAGMVGGKLFGWAWRRYRKKRKRLKEELAVLRKHAAEVDKATRQDSDED